MKLAYLTPEGSYDFFGGLVAPLRAAGVDVAVNSIPADAGLVLAGILPATPAWYGPLAASGKPVVLWHWDLYSFVDLDQPRWSQFLRLLPEAAAVWSCSYETARQLKEVLGLDSDVVPAWVDAAALGACARAGGDYVFYAASSGAFGKRVDWAEKACAMEGCPLTLTTGQRLTRAEYLSLLGGCRVYLMTAFEESNGSIPAVEAAAAGKALVVADIPANREAFGDTAYYFPPADFRGLRAQLRRAWAGGPLPGVRERAARLFDGATVFPQIIRRLRGLYADLPTGAR